jgi:hypothetical protein
MNFLSRLIGWLTPHKHDWAIVKKGPIRITLNTGNQQEGLCTIFRCKSCSAMVADATNGLHSQSMAVDFAFHLLRDDETEEAEDGESEKETP